MAYTKILVIHNRLDKCVNYALNEKKTSLSSAIDYTLNRDKTEMTCFETAINCDRDTAHAEMLNTKRRWGKDGSGHVRGYHIIQSFAPGEITPRQAHNAGMVFATRLLGDRYEIVVSTHLDKAHLHNHVVFNSVSFIDGRMYRNSFRDYFGADGVGIRGTSDAVCRENGFSVIEPSGEGKQYSEWKAEKSGKPTIRDLVRKDIDAAIASSYTYKTFLQQLQRQGYEIRCGPNIKHTTLRPPWGKKNMRLNGLGQGYTEEAIKARLASARSEEGPPMVAAEPPCLEQTRYIPRRRYHVRGGIHCHPRKLHGFRALYFKYLYLLGIVPKRRPGNRAALFLREEVIRFDRYQAQFCYLQKNRIETAAQLSIQYDAIQAEIDALSDWRRELYRLHRSSQCADTATEEIETVTTKLRALRRELKLCARIEGDVPRVKEAVRASTQDRSVTDEKTDKSRPMRYSAADPGLSIDESRAH